MEQKKTVCPNAADIEKCIFGIANGNGDSLKQLYELISPSVYAYTLTVVRNVYDAEDILHDTIVKVYENAPAYIPHGKPMAWILTITKNLCYTKFRQQSRFSDVSDEDLEKQFSSNEAITEDDKILLTYCLSELGEEERSIVVLHAVSGMKHREIATLLQIPLSTVLSKYNRALKKLKAIIKEDSLG